MRYSHPTSIPRSKTFTSLEWLGEPKTANNEFIKGDTYPIAWSNDDQLYVGTGDPCWIEIDGKYYENTSPETPELNDRIYSGVSGHVIEKITGDGDSFDVERINDMIGQNASGGNGPKPTGMISVDGVLYYAAQNLLGWKPPRHGVASQHGSDATILRSDDYGKTWTPDLSKLITDFQAKEFSFAKPLYKSWKSKPEERIKIGDFKPMFPGNLFGGPSFIQYGKDNTDAIDNYVYAVSGDQWDNGSELRLGRVDKNHITDPTKWEFAILDDTGNVSWTDTLHQSTPILTIDRHISTPEMIYLPKHKKYLLLTWGLHTDFIASTGSELTVLESDNPWGPFSLVHYEWMWYKEEACHYCPRIPLKWFDEDTLSGHMLYSGSWELQDIYYKPYTRKFKLNTRSE